MTSLRLAAAVLLFALVGLPLFPLVQGLFDANTWQWSARDLVHAARLAGTTLALAAGACAAALPPAVALGLATTRGRGRWRGAGAAHLGLIACLFVPLPVVVSSWQGLFDGLGLAQLWQGSGRPWATGFAPAVAIHALAALPWLAVLAGTAFRWVEPELEEEALLARGAAYAFFGVTLRRALPALAMATLFVAIGVANEMTVTDFMQVSTLAEEVHTQFTMGQRQALARTLVLSFPWLAAAWLGVAGCVWRLGAAMPPLAEWPRSNSALAVRSRPLAFAAAGLVVLLLTTPLVGLLIKLGSAGSPRTWSLAHLVPPVVASATLHGWEIAASLGVAAGSGAFIATLGLLVCWLAHGSPALSLAALALLTFVWVLPAPVVGIALHDSIGLLVRELPDGVWSDWLYYGPSPLPVIWVQTMRFLPVATVFLWPTVRNIPGELRDAGRMAGATPWGEFRYLVWSMARRAWAVTALGMTALCLGEVGASARVETPGWQTFAKLLFDRMHYGVEASVAALSVVMLAVVGAAVLAAAWLWPRE